MQRFATMFRIVLVGAIASSLGVCTATSLANAEPYYVCADPAGPGRLLVAKRYLRRFKNCQRLEANAQASEERACTLASKSSTYRWHWYNPAVVGNRAPLQCQQVGATQGMNCREYADRTVKQIAAKQQYTCGTAPTPHHWWRGTWSVHHNWCTRRVAGKAGGPKPSDAIAKRARVIAKCLSRGSQRARTRYLTRFTKQIKGSCPQGKPLKRVWLYPYPIKRQWFLRQDNWCYQCPAGTELGFLYYDPDKFGRFELACFR